MEISVDDEIPTKIYRGSNLIAPRDIHQAYSAGNYSALLTGVPRSNGRNIRHLDVYKPGAAILFNSSSSNIQLEKPVKDNFGVEQQLYEILIQAQGIFELEKEPGIALISGIFVITAPNIDIRNFYD